jgi:hypothetical protein
MHFIIGFAILVTVFSLFPRTAFSFACLAGRGAEASRHHHHPHQLNLTVSQNCTSLPETIHD